MPPPMGGAHRAGPLKQSNKSHKTGQHRSKGAVDLANKGRVGVKVATGRSGQGHRWVQKRKDRKYQMTQLRNKKKAQVWAQKRALGAADAPPILTAWLDCQVQSPDLIPHLEALLGACDPDMLLRRTPRALHLACPRFKQRFAFVQPPTQDLLSVLDSAKVCDSIVFLCSALELESGGLAPALETILAAVLAQGLPTPPGFVLTDMADWPIKRQNAAKKTLLKALNQRFAIDKIFTCQTEAEALLFLRHLGSQKRRTNSLRQRRAHLVAEKVEFLGESALGTLKVTGFVRSQTLSADRLVHLPGLGSYQIQQIESARDEFPLDLHRRTGAHHADIDMGSSVGNVIATPNPTAQESLEMENEPDMFDGEQYLSPEEEALAQQTLLTDGPGPKTVVRVPKGTSEYQAAWIMDQARAAGEENESEEDDEEEDSDEEMIERELQDDDEDEPENEDEYETMTITSEANMDENYDEKHVNFAEEKQLLNKMKEARMEEMFPDEVDTPTDQTARQRFQKYRGLKSFRTSPWDYNENLTPDYARIFQFENFNRTKKRVLNEEVDGAEPGWYVSIYIKDFPQHMALEILANENASQPLVVYSMLPHENKMSVLNFVVKRHSLGHQDPIRSKERLIFHCGFRRFAACPIFSQHTNGSKHKYERFWRENATVVMTVFAPIVFPPANVVVYQELANGRHDLVGTGSLLSCDPNRLVIKRAVLSGAPFKVQKRSAVIRFMFFNREDIAWFKPIELRTKYGRRGHIKEPLGTHGHMKCIFDKPISQQDTVLLNLFKRVFPKWNYDPHVAKPSTGEDLMEDEGSEVLQLKKNPPKSIVKSKSTEDQMACD
ncbi:hypothetical protein TCAL_06410 [Tigriopus californicus]|uniref:Pre-rRNA-processing protein TSR1 homolog n=2 Tax=Tigriopus californicus TaxID=6832 RepID=A0A553PCR1_TIGCA|nr:hypothetical protein TCAL_06410 [Tigriopus californicus]|eukprot:TCALIF_06410-PA protein Name:"Similar to tsr1 Pre-rRNA-processing protein TSR1 homolog (Xenopus laevis)" AED:0.33 eAED:0.33 QI:0/-1/0/1/-1/1/1/0/834